MARIAWTARVRADRIADYDQAHAAVWPEVLKLIKEAGVSNYSIFRHADRLFGYYECDDPVRAQAQMEAGERKVGWTAAMAELFESEVAERGADYMVEVFRLD